MGWQADPREPRLEYEIEAAFMLNFTKFIDWPASVFATLDAPFRICISGEDPFGGALAKIVEGERVNSHPLAVERVSGEPPAYCEIVFFAKSEKNVAQTISHLGIGVLTVSDADDFLRSGGIIRFVLDNNHVRFDVNQTAARKEDLKISSRLLRVARAVESGGRD